MSNVNTTVVFLLNLLSFQRLLPFDFSACVSRISDLHDQQKSYPKAHKFVNVSAFDLYLCSESSSMIFSSFTFIIIIIIISFFFFCFFFFSSSSSSLSSSSSSSSSSSGRRRLSFGTGENEYTEGFTIPAHSY